MRLILIFLTLILNIHVAAQIPVGKSLKYNPDSWMQSLYLDRDSIFYHLAGGDCSSSKVTKGKWSVNGNKLVLTGFDSADCAPALKATELETKNDSVTVKVCYKSKADKDFLFSYINCDKPLQERHYGEFFDGKCATIPYGYCTKIFLSYTGKGYVISGIKDVEIDVDYPTFMLQGNIDLFSLGQIFYTIKGDGLYNENGNRVYSFDTIK